MKNNDDLTKLGLRIRKAREGAGMTQNDLHFATGISITQISAYENGKRSIGIKTLSKIAHATGKTMDEIYEGGMETEPINRATNKGELIANCIDALCTEGVLALDIHEVIKLNDFDSGLFLRVGFANYEEILDDLVGKLIDFNRRKDDYPNPKSFKEQILAAAAKNINAVLP